MASPNTIERRSHEPKGYVGIYACIFCRKVGGTLMNIKPTKIKCHRSCFVKRSLAEAIKIAESWPG